MSEHITGFLLYFVFTLAILGAGLMAGKELGEARCMEHVGGVIEEYGDNRPVAEERHSGSLPIILEAD